MEMDGKEYFVTKPELARKMIEKIPDSEWKKAENILAVNSKVGEWVIEIYKKYGKEVANRVKIVPAGEKTKLFIKKSLNILGLNEYNILDIEDKNGNGTYDVRDFLDLDNEKIIELCNMPKGSRFSCCIMNPPYDKNLHLKFLEKTANISDKVISIQPVRWLQDPFANDKRSTLKSFKSIAEKINDIEVLSNSESNANFDIAIYSDLGIYTIDNINTNKIDYNNFWKTNKTKEEISIIEKVCLSNKTEKLSELLEGNKKDGIRVPIGLIGGNRGSLPVYKDIIYTINGNVGDKDWTECKNMGGYEKPKGSALPVSIKFNSIEEAENFWKSYKNLKFFKVLCDITIQQQHIQPQVLPFLNNYKHEITDEEMYKLFNLTDKEIEYIKNY